MKTNFSKKLLACVLSLCMILTVCAGALSVSAAVAGTATIYDTEVDPGATTAEVAVEIAADAAIGGADLFITVPEVADITTVDIATDGYDITFASNGTDVSATAGTPAVATVDEVDNVAQFVILANGEFAGDTSVVITLTFTGEFEGTYPVSFAEGTLAGTTAEEAIELTLTNGNIIAHAHDYVAVETAPTCTTAGYTTYTCSSCGDSYKANDVDALGHTAGDAVVENNVAADCDTAGSYDSVVYCTVCKEEMSRNTITVEATGHTPADAVVENNVDPDCVNAGSYDSVVYCTVCDTEVSRTTVTVDALGHAYGTPVDNGDGTHTATCANDDTHTVTAGHEYVDGTCVCGATEAPAGPTVDDTLVVAGAAVGFGTSSLQVNFRIRNTVLTKYSNMELVIIPQKYDATTLNLATPEEIVIPYAGLSGTGTFRTYAYTDIQLYELGLEIQYLLRGTDTSGNTVVSPTYSTSPAGYLRDLTASDDYMATLIADTLIVGQLAVENMAVSYPDSDLAAADSIIEGYDTSAATQDFDMESCNKVDTHNATDSNWGNGSTGTHRMTKSVSIGKAPYVSFRIRGGSSIDLDKLSITASFTQVAGDGSSTVVTKTYTSADTANLYKQGSFVMFKYDSLGIPDGNANVTFVATYDGAEVFNAVYSVETYFYNNMSTLTTELQELATAILKLGVSFRANASK